MNDKKFIFICLSIGMLSNGVYNKTFAANINATKQVQQTQIQSEDNSFDLDAEIKKGYIDEDMVFDLDEIVDLENANEKGDVVLSKNKGRWYRIKARFNSGHLQIDGSKYTRIMNGAFQKSRSIKDLTILDGLKTIGNNAFRDCVKIKSVITPSSLTTIGHSAFSGCRLLENVILRNGLNTISDYAFFGTGIKNITIPSTVERIGPNAFSSCPNLNGIIINNGVKTIENNAFSNCSVKTVDISKTVQKIGSGAFSRCENLYGVSIFDDGEIDTIEDYAFANCSSLEKLTIPKSVTNIGRSAFENSGLKTIDLKTNIKVGVSAFKDCVYLKDVNIQGLTSIPEQMFSNSGITKITIHKDIASIGKSAFCRCCQLEKVTIENSEHQKQIEENSFFRNIALKSIHIPKCITKINNNAFAECSALKNVTIDDGVTIIGNEAFRNNIRLKTVTVGSNVKSIGDTAFAFCLDLKNIDLKNIESIGQTAFFNSGLKSVKLPKGLTAIRKLTFGSCKQLKEVEMNENLETICAAAFFASGLKAVTVPGNVKSINKCAFGMCKKLKNVTIEHGTKSIGELAFTGCTSLMSISIPSSVDAISHDAFLGCKRLQEITTTEGGKKDTTYKIELDERTGKIKTNNKALESFLAIRGYFSEKK